MHGRQAACVCLVNELRRANGALSFFQRNTYQVALVTDEIRTFAIFNYYNITWLGSPTMGCNSADGKPSSSNPNCKAAQVILDQLIEYNSDLAGYNMLQKLLPVCRADL